MKIEIEVDQEVGRSDKVWLIETAIEKISSSIRQDPNMWTQRSGILELEGEVRGKWEIRGT